MKFRLLEYFEDPAYNKYIDRAETLTEQEVIDLLSSGIVDEIDSSSAMFITSDGSMISTDALYNDCDTVHDDLGFMVLYSLLLAEEENEDSVEEVDRLINDTDSLNEHGHLLAEYYLDKFNWIRINPGNSFVEDRFYCVFPNSRPTDAAFRTFENFVQFGIDNNKKEILVFAGNQHKKYYLDIYDADDIVKKVKRYYASGILYEELTENSYELFNKLYSNILQNELSNINTFLDKYGMEVELVDDYEVDDELKDAVGIFCNEIQDNASVFPIYINKDNIYKYLEEDGFENDVEEINDAIEGTLWHEAGHGIINYVWDEYEFDDEEEAAEDFARYKENSELAKTLEEYVNEI